MNLDTTIKALKFDEMQTRLWFLAGAGSWATVGSDFVIRIWKLLKDGELNRIQELTDHTDVVTEIKYASKIDCFISSSLDGNMKMWTASNFRLRHTETLVKRHGLNSKLLKGAAPQNMKENNMEGVRGFLLSNSSDNLLICWGFSNEIKIYEASSLIGFERMGKLEGHMGVCLQLQDCNQLCAHKFSNICYIV